MNTNKEKIFNVSIDLFAEKGYDGVSIREIARNVGIKESSIYNHYRSKESILDAILDYYIHEMTTEEIPLSKASENMDMGIDYFYRAGLETYKSKLSEDKMMKITRIILIESYHNEKISRKHTVRDISACRTAVIVVRQKRAERKRCAAAAERNNSSAV